MMGAETMEHELAVSAHKPASVSKSAVSSPIEVMDSNKIMHRQIVVSIVKRLWNGKRLEKLGSLEYMNEVNINTRDWDEQMAAMGADADNLLAVPLLDGIPCGVLMVCIEGAGPCIIVFKLHDLNMIRMFRVPIVPSAETLFQGTLLVGTYTIHKKNMLVYLWDWVATQAHTAANNPSVTFNDRQTIMGPMVTVLAQTFESHPVSFALLPVLPMPFTNKQYMDTIQSSSIPCVGLRFVKKNAMICDGMQTWVWRKVFFVKLTSSGGNWMCTENGRSFKLEKVFPKMELGDVPHDLTIDATTIEFSIQCTDTKKQTFLLQPKQVVSKGMMSSIREIETTASDCLRRVPWTEMRKFSMK